MSASVNVNGPTWLVAEARRPPCALRTARLGMMPTLVSRPAIGRSGATGSAAARRALGMSDKSQTTDTAWPAGCARISVSTSLSLPGSRPTSTTVPCLASSSAVRRPIPDVGPVMTHALAGDVLWPVFCMSIPLRWWLRSGGGRDGEPGEYPPDGVERDAAEDLGLGRLADHRVDRRVGDRVRQGQDEAEGRIPHRPAGPAPLQQVRDAAERSAHRPVTVGGDVIRYFELCECPPLLRVARGPAQPLRPHVADLLAGGAPGVKAGGRPPRHLGLQGDVELLPEGRLGVGGDEQRTIGHARLLRDCRCRRREA